ncbi:MAG: domain containing protein [Ignavibacteria bacterium]|nr:domain containing protein [Ignavibacteria bacterium]
MKKLFLFFLIFLSQTLGILCQKSIYLQGTFNWVNIGDLDVSGKKITVEAIFKQTTTTGARNLVSKHTDLTNCNYLLRPGAFAITTISGFFHVENEVLIENNICYHVAATYDGETCKYYVNGCLSGQISASGDLVQNNYLTAIGNKSDMSTNEQFTGYIDEVRIWNIARTQQEIQENMGDLPNPKNQFGLLAYYKFEDNYENLQGNTKWNGIPYGKSLFLSDSLIFQNNISSVIYIFPNTTAIAGSENFPLQIKYSKSPNINITNKNYLFNISYDASIFLPTPSDNITKDTIINNQRILTVEGKFQENPDSIVTTIYGTICIPNIDTNIIHIKQFLCSNPGINIGTQDGNLIILNCSGPLRRVELRKIQSVALFPNPASNNMVINIDNVEEGNYSLMIYNLQGLLLSSMDFYSIKSNFKQQYFTIDHYHLHQYSVGCWRLFIKIYVNCKKLFRRIYEKSVVIFCYFFISNPPFCCYCHRLCNINYFIFP